MASRSLWRRFLFLIGFCVFLNGCALSPNPLSPNQNAERIPKQSLFQQRQAALRALNKVNLNGSFTYHSPAQKEYARFNLTFKNPEEYVFKITSPIGTTILSLTVNPDLAILQTQNGDRYEGATASELIERLTPFHLPLADLYQWILGISDEALAQNINDQGALYQGEFYQNTAQTVSELWRWQVLEWQTVTHDDRTLTLPKQLELSHKDIHLALKIARWNLL